MRHLSALWPPKLVFVTREATSRVKKASSPICSGKRPLYLFSNGFSQWQPSGLLLFHESDYLSGCHRARIAAYVAQFRPVCRIIVDLCQIGADFGDDRLRRAARRQQHLPADSGESQQCLRNRRKILKRRKPLV